MNGMEPAHQLHDSIERLYRAAIDALGDDAPAKVARRLNTSAQTLQNWELRGISKDGALKAQLVYECDANWLLGESGSETWRGPAAASQPLRLDADMIAETHAALRLAYEEDGREYLIEDDPARFVRVYELRSTLSAHPTQDEWVQYGRQLQAIIAPQGAPPSGPNDGSSADGPHPKGVARRVRRKA